MSAALAACSGEVGNQAAQETPDWEAPIASTSVEATTPGLPPVTVPQDPAQPSTGQAPTPGTPPPQVVPAVPPPALAPPPPASSEANEAAQAFFRSPDFTPTKSRIWRLTWKQYDNSVSDLLGEEVHPSELLDGELLSGGYRNQSAAGLIDARLAGQLGTAAEQMAERALLRLPELLPCTPASAEDVACVDEFLTSFVRRAYRRPATAEEQERIASLYRAGSEEFDAETGLRLAIQTVLRSPHFLFRTEAGDATAVVGDAVMLTPHETAAALSYGLVNAPPDEALRAAAENDSLRSREGLRTHAERLIATPAFRDNLARFASQWLEYDELLDNDKSAEVYPDYSAGTAQDMLEEARLFVADAIEAGNFKQLIAGSHSFITPELASTVYGLPESGEAGGFTRVEHDPMQRAGLLTMPAFLASKGAKVETQVTKRGVFVLGAVACLKVGAPDEGITVFSAAAEAAPTARERFEEHTTNPACATCHAIFDPLGLALENFDSIGRFRTEENGATIDPAGELAFLPAGENSFSNAAEMARLLSESPQVQQCFARQTFRYVFGRKEVSGDEPTLAAAYADFIDSQFDISKLHASLYVSDTLLLRKPAESLPAGGQN